MDDPGNRAIAFSSRIAYGLYRVTEAPADNWAKPGDAFVLAKQLAGEVFAAARVGGFELVKDVGAETLRGESSAPIPLHAQGYAFPVPLLAGDHVTEDTGTGFRPTPRPAMAARTSNFGWRAGGGSPSATSIRAFPTRSTRTAPSPTRRRASSASASSPTRANKGTPTRR